MLMCSGKVVSSCLWDLMQPFARKNLVVKEIYMVKGQIQPQHRKLYKNLSPMVPPPFLKNEKTQPEAYKNT